MSTVRVGGVRFRIHPQDHLPMHVHARYAEAVVIVELRADGTVALAKRDDAVIPPDAKRNDVRKILNVAGNHYEQIEAAWKEMHDED